MTCFFDIGETLPKSPVVRGENADGSADDLWVIDMVRGHIERRQELPLHFKCSGPQKTDRTMFAGKSPPSASNLPPKNMRTSSRQRQRPNRIPYIWIVIGRCKLAGNTSRGGNLRPRDRKKLHLILTEVQRRDGKLVRSVQRARIDSACFAGHFVRGDMRMPKDKIVRSLREKWP